MTAPEHRGRRSPRPSAIRREMQSRSRRQLEMARAELARQRDRMPGRPARRSRRPA